MQTKAHDHLRHAHKSEAELRTVLLDIVTESELLTEVLQGLFELDFPDSWVVSGAIYNTIWNHLTGTPELSGIKDVDLVYFDDTDLSYEAEDRFIKRAESRFASLPVPVELRNQARVHLWYPQKFGMEVAPFTSSLESLRYYASKTHAVALRKTASNNIEIDAPFGLSDIFAMRVIPNPVRPNRSAHEEKGMRAQKTWPQIELVPWPNLSGNT